MPEATTTETTETAETTTTAPGTETEKDWKAEAEKWQTLARKHEERSKANATAAKELDELKQRTMSEQEKAVEEAKKLGRTEALVETGAKLVAAEFRATAAGRLNDDQVVTLLEGLNLGAFLTAEGDVDQAKVAKYVDGIAPQPDENGTSTRRFPDLGQGARGGGGGNSPTSPLNGDPLLRDLKSKLGIS